MAPDLEIVTYNTVDTEKQKTATFLEATLFLFVQSTVDTPKSVNPKRGTSNGPIYEFQKITFKNLRYVMT
jgi:hypothetical protein